MLAILRVGDRVEDKETHKRMPERPSQQQNHQLRRCEA
jgi:hypothetical protein